MELTLVYYSIHQSSHITILRIDCLIVRAFHFLLQQCLWFLIAAGMFRCGSLADMSRNFYLKDHFSKLLCTIKNLWYDLQTLNFDSLNIEEWQATWAFLRSPFKIFKNEAKNMSKFQFYSIVNGGWLQNVARRRQFVCTLDTRSLDTRIVPPASITIPDTRPTWAFLNTYLEKEIRRLVQRPHCNCMQCSHISIRKCAKN